ncbi:MAG TPA: hypothetical protein VN931_05375 [Fibrobacteria bacterium]|nr:hypothetical protein [Fibrobacteria bacterium]
MGGIRKIDEFLLLLHRGEVPPRLTQVARELAASTEGRARMAELVSMEAEVVRTFPAEEVTAELRRRLGETPVAGEIPENRRTNWWVVGVVLAVLIGGLAVGISFLLPSLPKDTNIISTFGLAPPIAKPSTPAKDVVPGH